MVAEMRQFLDTANLRPSAADAEIADGEQLLGLKFPTEYTEFLRITNGCECFIGKNAYVSLWRVEELGSKNHAYEVQENAPGLLIFGSDGGGEAYGFDTRTPGWPIVQIPFIGMSWDAATPTGESFSAFLQMLYETEE